MQTPNIKYSPSQLQREGFTYNPVPDEVRRMILEHGGDRALSLYLEVTSHAKNFKISAKMLAARLNWNPKTVTKYLAILNKLGLATMQKIREKGGRFLGSFWRFAQLPQEAWKPMAEEQRDFFDDRDTVLPTVHEPVPEELTTTKDITKINLDGAQASPAQKATNTEKQQAFERFYSKYPRKLDRARAERVFMRIVKNMTIERLDEFTEKLWQDVNLRTQYDAQWRRTLATDKSSIPYPKAYLSGERWNDDWEPVLNGETKELETFVAMGGTLTEFLEQKR